MALPRFVVLQSKYNSKYLRYIKDDVEVPAGYLKFSGEEIVSPYAKYEVEMAKSEDGLVNIRCCYNNKYWVRSSQDDLWVVARANEPEEDKFKWSCTLFKPVYIGDKTIRFQHVQLGHYACLPRIGTGHDSCLYAGSKEENSDQCDVCTIIDWESLLILPKHIAFKGDNGKYLSVYCISHRDPAESSFLSSDIGDETVGNEVFITHDGSVRIKSDYTGKFWSINPHWGSPLFIWAQSNDTSSDSTLFRPIKVDNRSVALRNLGYNYFCKRDTLKWSHEDCLYTGVRTISREACLEVEELVLSRSIYNVNYDIINARIYNQSLLTIANETAINRTQEPNTIDMKFVYSEKKTRSWNNSVSLKLGIKTSINAGVPWIFEGKLEVSAEFSGEYKWGETEESSTVVETLYKVNVPAMTKVTVSLLVTNASYDVPFSYCQRDLLTNGDDVILSMDDGVYTGINSFNFNYEAKHEKL